MAKESKNKHQCRAFIGQVQEFVDRYTQEYLTDHSWSADLSDPDKPRADVQLEFFGGSRYTVPIVSHLGEAAIDVGDAGRLSLDGHGLYAYLFHMADANYRQLATQAERAKTAPAADADSRAAVGTKHTSDLCCPKCSAQGQVDIVMSGKVSIDSGRSGRVMSVDLGFDGSSACACQACGYPDAVRAFDPDEDGAYTVVLLYPDHATGDYGADIFVDATRAATPREAVIQVQAAASDANEGDIDPDDFRMIAVFAGDVAMELGAGE